MVQTSRRAGFSAMELVFAAGLLGLLVGAVTQTHVGLLDMQARLHDECAALAYLDNVVERLRVEPAAAVEAVVQDEWARDPLGAAAGRRVQVVGEPEGGHRVRVMRVADARVLAEVEVPR